ncbi:MAG TPA: YraN family protein [Coriobacteriaceae bacterium]|nr:YraN family protein [Coriobacteriaceae bacterium]
MAAKAQIAYPGNDEEVPDDEHDTIKDEEARGDECGDGSTCDIDEDLLEFAEGKVKNDEGEAGAANEDAETVVRAPSVPPDRSFDISPEEFCGDPYEQEGHIESRQELGRKGEEAAVRYLKSRGYTIVKRNWFCRFGEADIIARDPEDTLCFIEVKTRQSLEAGLPEEAITRNKQSRYERIALCYMMVTDDWDDNSSVRFDAIAICVTAPHRALLRHHKGCFNECF